MGRVGVHLAAIGIGQAENVARKLDDHHLHAQTDAEAGHIVGAGILGGQNLALRAALSEARADDEAVHRLEFLFKVFAGEKLGVDERYLHLAVVVGGGVREALVDTLVGILQVVLAHKADAHHLRGRAAQFEEVTPRTKFGRLAHGQPHLAHDGTVQALPLHIDGHLVDAGQVLALDDAFQVHVAESRHLHAHVVVEVLLCAEHEHVGLNAVAEHLLDRMLGGLGLEFVGRAEIGHVGEVYAHGVATEFPFELSDGFKEGRAFDVADGAADFGDDEVVLARFAEVLHALLNFVGDVGHDLNGLAEVVAAALLVDDGFVDAARGHAVFAGGLYAREAFVVAEVEVGLHAIYGDVAFAVLVGIERARVDIDIGVKLLDGNLVAACLQQFTDGGRNDAFA